MNITTNNQDKLQVAVSALQYVIDPEVGLNVIDLGLIYALDFYSEDKKIFCVMTLTTEYCPMGDVITDGVYRALNETFDGYAVQVTISFDPPWTQERISPEGKAFLQKYR